MTDQEASHGGEPSPQYMIFLLVFFFFLTGLLGFLICHMLKKKGYRCRTGDLEEEEECKDKLAPDDGLEENQDTVEQILKCIIENEANMEAFKEMLGNQNACEHNVASKLPRKESLGGLPPHHHTVHSVADRNSCHLCAQNRSKKARRRNRAARSKGRPGEQTVFSVGRFRVTHMEKKNSLQGSPNLPVIETGDRSEHAAPLEDRDDPGKPPEGYNLRNMFKHVSPTNGEVAADAKRKKSVTLLVPWRRGDEEAAMAKAQEAAGAMVDVDLHDDDDDGADDPPDSTEPPESPAPPPEEGTDTDVPTDSEMAGDKAPVPGEGPRPVEEEEVEVVAVVVAPKQPLPPQIREFSVVRMGEPADQGAAPGEYGRDDMVEMEDIKDCRVSQEEDSRHSLEEKRRSLQEEKRRSLHEEKRRSLHEEKRRSVHTQHKW